MPCYSCNRRYRAPLPIVAAEEIEAILVQRPNTLTVEQVEQGFLNAPPLYLRYQYRDDPSKIMWCAELNKKRPEKRAEEDIPF